MNNRLAEVRRKLQLSQAEFGERVGLSKNYVWMVEKGERTLSARATKDICRTYNISYEWLTTGEGEIFEDVSDSAINALVAAYQLDEQDKKIITAFLGLNAEERAGIIKFVENLTK